MKVPATTSRILLRPTSVMEEWQSGTGGKKMHLLFSFSVFCVPLLCQRLCVQEELDRGVSAKQWSDKHLLSCFIYQKGLHLTHV